MRQIVLFLAGDAFLDRTLLTVRVFDSTHLTHPPISVEARLTQITAIFG